MNNNYFNEGIMITKIFLSCTLILIIILNGCNEKSEDKIIAPNTNAIEYLSFQSYGCQPLKKLSKINDWATINCNFQNDSLVISTMFSTHCSAIMEDSIITTENKIEIYLWDTNNGVSRCICTHKEVFLFNAESPKTIEIILFYKAATNEGFDEMGRKTIKI
jgi:hypothetical protein